MAVFVWWCSGRAIVGSMRSDESPTECLSRLTNILALPIPEKPTAKYITDTAQNLVEHLNDKRKNDVQLLDHFKQSLEAMVSYIYQVFYLLVLS